MMSCGGYSKVVVRAWISVGFVLVEACCSAKRSSPNIFALFLGFVAFGVFVLAENIILDSRKKSFRVEKRFVNVYRSVYGGLSKVDQL